MSTRTGLARVAKVAAAVVAVGTAAVFALFLIGAPASSHAAEASTLGTPRSTADLEAVVDQPGVVRVETVVAAHWKGPLEGLLNLDHPEAKRAGLQDRLEPIEVYFHALRHPAHGLFLVDTGMERAFVDHPDQALIRGMRARAIQVDTLKVENHLGGWLARQVEPVRGVFMTHLHFDHVTGMRDVPNDAPVHIGPGEVEERDWTNWVARPMVDEALAGKPALRRWAFRGDVSGQFDGVLDVFGDGMVWALLVLGHTGGSTAYLVRTPTGPVLLTGDACHTAWGWEHGVEPGNFSSDKEKGAASLQALRRFVKAHSKVDVRLGHQGRAR